MSSQQSSQVTSSTFKSSSVSVSSPAHNIVITHTSPVPPSQFTNLIETEKTLLHDERGELVTPNDYSTNEPVVVVTNPGSELTDDDECDREINRITNYRSSNGRTSPEPSGNHELAGLRDGVVVRVGSIDVDEVGVEGVEFQEFCVDDAFNVSSKSSSKSVKQSYVKTVQSQSSVEKVSKSEAVTVTTTESSNLISSSVDATNQQQQICAENAMVNQSETAGAITEDVSKETGKKGTKVERKTSKAGKKKGNAEISKENISVTTLTNGHSNGQEKPVLIPEDLAKKLGPGESRVFAKVCVANLRRSFGDLTALSALSPADSISANKQFTGSNSLEYNRINCNSNRDFKCNVRNSGGVVISATRGAGPSSLPLFCNRNNMSATNKLQLFQPAYWEGLLGCSSSDAKSSFSKFDSLVSKNSCNGNVAVENKESIAVSESSDSVSQATKPEAKKMFCASCDKQVFQMELIRAEKKDWHKNCFRCVSCRKVLSVDTYQSHEQRLYCKPHFKELFQPKAVVDDGQEERSDSAASKSSDKRSKLQLIICESQPKELPPDVVRASDAPSTGLEDIQIDVRSKFELFEGLKEKKDEGGASPQELVVKRSASVLAKLKKYESSALNGNTELEGVSDEDLHGVDGIELQSDEETGYEENSVIKDEIKRKLKNPLQALNEIAHFKQMEQVRSKWEEGTFTRDQINAEQRKEELQKFRSRLCQGKSGQLKELYEKGVENGGDGGSERRAEIEELKSERAKAFREMFEKGEVIRHGDDEEEGEGAGKRGGVDLEVFEAGVARESKKIFEELDRKVCSEGKEEVKRARFVNKVKLPRQFCEDSGKSPGDVVRSSDKIDEPLKVDTAELSNKFKFFETYEEEIARKAKEGKRDAFKRVTPPREDGVVKTEKDYDEADGEQTYRDPSVVRHGEVKEDDTLQKSKTTSKMLSVFRQMEENLSKAGDGKDPIIRPLKQFTPPRDTIGSRVVDSEDEECEEDEEEEEVEEEDAGEEMRREDEFLKEVGSLARARSLRAKFERWEQQENERNRNQVVPDELAESIESAKNLKAKFEAMRLMGEGGNKENGGGGRGVPIKVNRFVLNTNNLNSSSSSTSTSPQQLTQFCGFNSLPADVTNCQGIMSSGSENCAACEKRVYVMEKVEAGGKMYHKNCFKCSHCKCILRMGNFTSNKGQLYCKPHMIQLFKVKGNYDEGFGHETQYQQWAKNKQAQQAQT